VIGIDKDDLQGVDIVHNLEQGLPKLGVTPNVVLMNNYLEHCINPKEIIADCHEVLAPGGLVVVVVPFLIKLHQIPIDYFRYTPFSLDRLFRQVGFVDISITPLVSVQDTFEQMHRTFVDVLYADKWPEDTQSVTFKVRRRLINDAADRVFRISLSLYKSLLHKIPKYDERFTIGYGMSARKSH
jgi:hypothetical protein